MNARSNETFSILTKASQLEQKNNSTSASESMIDLLKLPSTSEVISEMLNDLVSEYLNLIFPFKKNQSTD